MNLKISSYQSALLLLSLVTLGFSSQALMEKQLKEYPSEYCLSQNGDSSKMIEECLIRDIDRNSDYVLKDGYIWKPDYVSSKKIETGLSDSQINKRKEAMKSEVVPWLANIIRNTAFFGDFSQRGVLACFGSWTAFMNQLIDKNNNFLIQNKDSIKKLFDLKKYFEEINNIYLEGYSYSNFALMRLVLPPEDEMHSPMYETPKYKKSGIVISPQRFSRLDKDSSDPEEMLMIEWHKHFFEMFLPEEFNQGDELFKGKILSNFKKMFEPYTGSSKAIPMQEILPVFFLGMLDPADLWSIMMNWRTVEDFGEYCDAHGAKPQGWYWRYEAIRSKGTEEAKQAASNISKAISHLHFPPNVSKNFVDNFFTDMVDKVPYNQLMVTPKGKKVWKRAAEFFGYADKCKDFQTPSASSGIKPGLNFTKSKGLTLYGMIVGAFNKAKGIDPTGFLVEKTGNIIAGIYSKIINLFRF